MPPNIGAAAGPKLPTPRLQIYSTANSGVSPFWREKYEREAKKYWDIFYKRHQDKFFKDRHYLDKEWGSFFTGAGKKVILEVGCGAGNTVFPLIATYPDIFVHACDFSPRAVDLVKMHKDFMETRIEAFVCDLTTDDLCKQISPSSVDIITMIFVLSAVSPEKMALVLHNIKKVLKPNGYVLFRDYATGDLAQERFIRKDQKISDNFYVRGDGTRAFYFSNEFLRSLFEENGFVTEEIGFCCKKVENRSREIVMNRRWIQAVFCCLDDEKTTSRKELVSKVKHLDIKNSDTEVKEDTSKECGDDFEIDMADGAAVEMFNTSPSTEVIEVPLFGRDFKIAVVSKEYQHTCKSTGLMLWESSRLIASILARNPSIVAGRRVLELGSGCGGICSMVAVRSANLVVATDGDSAVVDLLTENIVSNLDPTLVGKLITKRLEWGNRNHLESIKELNPRGFEVIIGNDVTYIPEAISPLFSTAKELLSPAEGLADHPKPALVLCHTVRRVDEPSIITAASQYGFVQVDQWPDGDLPGSSWGIIGSWFSGQRPEDLPSTALRIMYFQAEQ